MSVCVDLNGAWVIDMDDGFDHHLVGEFGRRIHGRFVGVEGRRIGIVLRGGRGRGGRGRRKTINVVNESENGLVDAKFGSCDSDYSIIIQSRKETIQLDLRVVGTERLAIGERFPITIQQYGLQSTSQSPSATHTRTQWWLR